MTPYYTDDVVSLFHGDCLDVMRTLPDASVHAVVTDPPYGLEFMGKTWDSFRTEETSCAIPTGTAPTTVETSASDASGAPFMQGSGVPPVAGSGGQTDPARAASARIVDADAIGGFQDGNGGNAYSRSRVRTNTQRHGGDAAVANARFGAWCELWARECLRVLKPGGHLLAFGGTRTWHRLACAVEDAGFEMRDSIAWVYGSGFPKSLDVSKAIDRAAGAEREVVGTKLGQPGYSDTTTTGRMLPTLTEGGGAGYLAVTAPATDAARTWQGWGTALKPAHEPIVVARKPLSGTVAATVLTHGTGALNIAACRVEGNTPGPDRDGEPSAVRRYTDLGGTNFAATPGPRGGSPAGRWPANVLLDSESAAELDRQSGTLTSNGGRGPHSIHSTEALNDNRVAYGDYGPTASHVYGDSGGASRFFPTFRYEPKAPTLERPRVKAEGSTGKVAGTPGRTGRECNVCGNRTVPKGGSPWPACGHEDWRTFVTEDKSADYTAHPTVKPLDLMRWLVRLVTPPGGIVFEPFAGSGTTAEACVIEGFRCIAIEREATYLPLIVARLSKPIQPDLFGGVA